MAAGKKIEYTKVWQTKLSGLSLFACTNDNRGIAAYRNNGMLHLIGHKGNELWQTDIGTGIVSISISDTFEVLAINKQKKALLIDMEGRRLWEKRPFASLTGKISSSGRTMSFVTPDPAVILTDKNMKIKWAYRNLLAVPADVSISENGETVGFPCKNDMGEGIVGVPVSGEAYDAFMGLDKVKSIEVSRNGEIILAIDITGSIFCINIAKSRGVWKGKLNAPFIGVSYADNTKEALVYAKNGLISKLDAKGIPIWEYRIPDTIISVAITSDGSAIYYALENGEVGCLMAGSASDMNRMQFLEIDVPEISSKSTYAFKQLWSADFNRSGRMKNTPCFFSWLGTDEVEHFITWDGNEQLRCINDVGEEVWENRLSGSDIYDVSVDSKADLIVCATARGMLGFDLSGTEQFKFLGQFKGVHLLGNGEMILVDNRGKAKFYLSPNHFSHNIEINDKILNISGDKENTILQSEYAIFSINKEGKIAASSLLENKCSFFKLTFAHDMIMVGTDAGEVIIFDNQLKEKFKYVLDKSIELIDYHKAEDSVYVVTKDSNEIVIFQCKTGEFSRNKLTGSAKFASCHEAGAIIGTEMDQLGLINSDGQIMARYTFPGKILNLISGCRNKHIMILSEDSISCYTAGGLSSSNNSTMKFLEI